MSALPVSATSALNHDSAAAALNRDSGLPVATFIHDAAKPYAAGSTLNHESALTGASAANASTASTLNQKSFDSLALRANSAGSETEPDIALAGGAMNPGNPDAIEADTAVATASAAAMAESALQGKKSVQGELDKTREALRLRVISDLKALAERLGRTPRMDEFRAVCPTPWLTFRRLFGQYRVALVEAAFERSGYGWELTMEELFSDWAEVVSKVKKIPSAQEYAKYGKYSVRPFMDRCKKWSRVPMKMLEYAEQNPGVNKWPAALTLVREELPAKMVDACTLTQQGYSREVEPKTGRALCGRPIRVPGMAFAPVNEMGVMCLFVALAQRLGYEVLSVQREFPDCEALRKLANGLWQRWIIEFEFESKEFLKHGHDPRNCDMIVCWKHNWKDCPVEVLELESVLVRLGLIAAE